MTDKQRLAIFNLCASMLHLNGLLTEKERDKVHKKILDFQDKNKIEITHEELTEGVDFKIKKSLK